MGYYMNQIDSKFLIKKENVQKAWNSLVESVKKQSSKPNCYWIGADEIIKAKTFEDAMEKAHWDLESDRDENVNSIYFNREKYSGYEIVILDSIAPYVENGSYIIMQGEDGCVWQWKFKNGEVEKLNGDVVFDNDSDDEHITKYEADLIMTAIIKSPIDTSNELQDKIAKILDIHSN